MGIDAVIAAGGAGGVSVPGTVSNGAIIWNGSNWVNQLVVGNNLDPAIVIPQQVPSRYRCPGVAESFPRQGTAVAATIGALVTSVCRLQAVELRAGQVISNIVFLSGTTPLATGTHQWFFLTDANRVQLATTFDDTSNAWAASAIKSLPVAAVAAGAAASYTIPSDGLYYFGICVTATTVPTMSGAASTALFTGIPPIIAGSSDTIATGPPGFPKTYGAITADSRDLYCYAT